MSNIETDESLEETLKKMAAATKSKKSDWNEDFIAFKKATENRVHPDLREAYSQAIIDMFTALTLSDAIYAGYAVIEADYVYMTPKAIFVLKEMDKQMKILEKEQQGADES